MKQAALVSAFIMFSSYAMEPDHASSLKITQITIPSARSFQNFINNNRETIKTPYRILFDGGIPMKYIDPDKRTISTRKRPKPILKHAMYRAIYAGDDPALVIYACRQDGREKAYIGSLYSFLQSNKSIAKTSLSSAIAVIQSKTRTLKDGPDSTLESFFGQIAALLNVKTLEKYWVRSSQDQQILSISLEPEQNPEDGPYMMLEDGRRIHFHTISQAKFDAKL